MWRALTVIGLAAAFGGILLVLLWSGGGAAVLAGPPSGSTKALEGAAAEWVKNNPKGRTEAAEKPVPKDNIYPTVSREDREAMGLPAPTWVSSKEKVQAVVRDALEAQRKLIGKNPMAMYQGDRPIGFQGTLFVDVYLSHKAKGAFDSKENQAAVKEEQDRLLSKLTAAEFAVLYAFENTAGLVGYVNDAGLKKLIDDPDVVAIGVDDQARPESVVRPRTMEERRRPRHGPTEMIGKITAEVYKQLEQSSDGWVFVSVTINQPIRRDIPAEEHDVLARKTGDRILSGLTAAEFRMTSRDFGLDGYVNASGLAKLGEHADVLSVKWGISYPRHLEGDDR
jgi:hypothetical protein